MRTFAIQMPDNRTRTQNGDRRVARTPPARRELGTGLSSNGELELQRKPHCACGGGCPRCQAPAPSTLRIGEPHDQHEQEAERIAQHVTLMADGDTHGMPAGPSIQRASAVSEGNGASAPPIVHEALRLPGQSLDAATRAFFEPRFGRDLSAVRVHTDGIAAASARAIHANAYTLGNQILFSEGLYQPHTEQGRVLLAHELTHVLQQGNWQTAPTIQRDCDNADFCKPYPTTAEAAAAEATIRSVYLPLEETKFGARSKWLYEQYLSRKPGDSLAPIIFDDPTSDVVDSFATSRNTDNDQDEIIDLIGARLSRAPGRLSDYTPTTMSIANFLSSSEMDNRPINYSNPFSIAGHIAGGIGSSDAGADYRKVWGNVTLEKVPLIGSTGYVSVETTLHYEVFDAIDFCPGDCGSLAEQQVTVPMSRLEASGEAYDVPFKVTFVGASRSKRFFYT